MKFKTDSKTGLLLQDEYGQPIPEEEVKGDDLKATIRDIIGELGITAAPTGDAANKAAAASRIEVVKDETDKLLESQKGEWDGMWEFCRDVVRADRKGGTIDNAPKLKAWHTAQLAVEGAEIRAATTGHMEESELATGGYLVPTEFRAQLDAMALEKSIVKGKATNIPMQTNRIEIPVVDVASHASNFFGGVTIYRPDEAGTITASRPKLGRIALTLHKLTGLVYMSDELINDSPISMEPLLTTMFASAIAFVEDEDYLTGNGSNQALGMFNSKNPSLVSVTRTTSSEINYADIVNMWARLHPSCHANAMWVGNNDTFPQLAQMSLAVGTGGAAVWLPANGVAGTPFGTLMGRPLMLSEKMQTMGTTPDLGLVDCSQYWIGQKAGGNLKTASSIHVAFTTDEVAFRFTMRYDGQPSWLNALTPRKGSNTLSPFVTIAT